VEDEPRSGKRDRLARMMRVVTLLQAHPDGMAIEEIARRIDMSRRTVYRDLKAIEGEIGIPLWSEDGRWGVAAEGFLPSLKFTLDEAMAVVLSARLMVRYADKYDPDLASAFEKLAAVLPAALRVANRVGVVELREGVLGVARDQVCARGPRRRAVPAEVRAHDLVPRDRVTQPRVGRAAARDPVQEQDRHDAVSAGASASRSVKVAPRRSAR